MSLYESEITLFLRSLKENRPQIEDGQQRGRAILWEKPPIDLNEFCRNQQIKVPQKPYVYQTD